MSAGGATAARNAQVLHTGSALLGAGCVAPIPSPKKESHAVPCARLQDSDQTSVAMEVFAVLLTGLRPGQKEDNDFIPSEYFTIPDITRTYLKSRFARTPCTSPHPLLLEPHLLTKHRTAIF